MPNSFRWRKIAPDPLRPLPFLPRVGIYFEVGGRAVSFKHVSILETLMVLRERGFTANTILKVIREQIDQIQFPPEEPKTIHIKPARRRKPSKAAAS